MFLNKKIIIGTLVPCMCGCGVFGCRHKPKHYKIMVNYNGQADLLLSLQIPPDYYPYQFKKTSLYDYLTNINPYIVVNEKTSSSKKVFKEKMQKKVTELLGKVQEFGPSLWNEELYNSGVVYRNDQFWSNKTTDLLFLEQFISDDYPRQEDAYRIIPRSSQIMITNHRAARDPYTIFSKEIYDCFAEKRNLISEKKCSEKNNQFVDKFIDYLNKYNHEEVNSLYRFGRYIDFWNTVKYKRGESWNKLNPESLIKQNQLFYLDEKSKSKIDKELAHRYMHHVFSPQELDTIKSWDSDFKGNYEKASHGGLKLVHHPVLEQQVLPGSTPLAEGSQKEIVIFLYQFAIMLDQYTKNNEEQFKAKFGNDYRKQAIEKVLNNAKEIGKNLEARIKNVRDYFKKIGVVDSGFDPEKGKYENSNSKTLAVLTYTPSDAGTGNATIQSMSKFPFIYYDIGLKQAIPKSIKNSLVHDHHHHKENENFSVDDNGWWWKIGSFDLNPESIMDFENTADTLLILANPDAWNILSEKNSNTMKAMGVILKDKSKMGKNQIDVGKINNEEYPVSYSKYFLWTEGLRSPIAINLLLDNLVNIFQKQYNKNIENSEEYEKAMDWGDYWYKHFVEGSNVEDTAIAS